MKSAKTVALSIASILFLLISNAHAVLTCPNTTSCFMNMPLYNQTDSSLGTTLLPLGGGSSTLCGPTASAMALQGVINSSWSPDAEYGWTASSFKGLTWQKQVGNMASLVGWTQANGTYFSPETNAVAGRAGDFQWRVFGWNFNMGSGSSTGWNVPVSVPSLINTLRNGYASVLMLGWYNQNTTNVLGTNWVTYARNGGHFEAISGEYGTTWIYLNDPWGGVTEWYQPQQLQSGITWGYLWGFIPYIKQVVALPDGQGTQGYLFNSGTFYGIMEGYTSLTAY